MERSDRFLLLGKVGIQLFRLRQSSFWEELMDAVCLKRTSKVSLILLEGNAGLLTAWCTNAARLQNAKVTSTDVRSPVLSFLTRSVAADRVISTSFGVSRSEEAISSTAEVFDAGLWTSHSLGMEAWMRVRFSAARSCQFDAIFRERYSVVLSLSGFVVFSRNR
jgi:hypothetical protein